MREVGGEEEPAHVVEETGEVLGAVGGGPVGRAEALGDAGDEDVAQPEGVPFPGEFPAGELLEDAVVVDLLAHEGEADAHDGVGDVVGGAAVGAGVGDAQDAHGEGGVELDDLGALGGGGVGLVDEVPEATAGAVSGGEDFGFGFEDDDEGGAHRFHLGIGAMGQECFEARGCDHNQYLLVLSTNWGAE